MHPVLFNLGAFPIYSYGAMAALSVLVAFLYTQLFSARFGMDKGMTGDLVFIIFVSGIVGARVFYVIQHGSDYAGRYLQIFGLREGGLVWYGGFFLSLVTGILYAKKRLMGISSTFDFFAPAIALAHGIGRIGCFLNGCCFGKDLVIPLQLLESGLLMLLSLLLFFQLKRPHRQGSVFGAYLAGYALIRFVLEFWRGDQEMVFFWTIPQWISVAVMVWVLWYRSIKK